MQLANIQIDRPEIEQFTHLHLHTIYSTLDGMCKLKPLAKRAKELQMSAVACTDHGHLGGDLAFQQAMKDQGIKPLLGMEAYTTEDMKKEALSADNRNALAVLDILKEEAVAASCDWCITKRKADQKPMEHYYHKLASLKAGETIEDDSRANKIIASLSLEDLPLIFKAFSKDEFNNFKRLNKKVFESYLYDTHQYHLILLAMNQTGWKNLVTLQSIASRDCQYNGRFLMDKELLRQYNEGIICTTACVGNHISKLIQRRKLDEAEQEILEYLDIFQDRFYLEIQPLSIPQQIVTNAFYLEMHQKYHIPVVATSDVHYINKEDWDIHDTYLCVAIGRLKDDELDKEVYRRTHKKDPDCKHWKKRMKYTNDFWFRSKDEMVDAFLLQEDLSANFFKNTENPLQTEAYRDFWIEALNTTNEVAARISDDILIGSPMTLYPKVKNLPKGFNSDQWLLAEAMDGLVKYANKMEKAGTPIDYWQYANKILDEMSVISTKHYSDYFLGVQEYINWANSTNPDTGLPYCVTGAGRGSACASLVLFLIGITHNIDPIKYNLMFSRFLTMDRNEPPDVDCDFSYRHRPLVIKHLEDVYGKDHVCHIGAWTTESIYTGIKDFARVLNIPPSVPDKINKELQALCGEDPKACFQLFDNMKETDPDKYKHFQELEEANKEVFHYARACEGVIRQWTTHASGVIACPESLMGMIPTRVDRDEKKGTETTIALFTGPECESIGLIKYDILGLKNLDMIEDTLNHIHKNFEWLYDNAAVDDKQTFKMICQQKTDGVFQVESDMFKGLVKQIQPKSLEDLAMLVAVGRPGPLSIKANDDLETNRKDPSKRKQYLRNTDDFLDRSSGVILYQEQLMQISVRCFGFNQSQSDSIMRKILGKKKVEQLPMLRRIMIYGMIPGKGPEGWKENEDSPWYDEKRKYGEAIPGGMKFGYTKEEIDKFFNDIQGFASYCFNLGHSLAYGYTALLTAYLKAHYPVPYMASVLSMQTDDKKKEKYMKVCEEMGIKITTPDINKSKENFTAIDDHTIAYGLSSIKGVNNVTAIIENAPYKNLRDAMERIPSKAFNKRVAEALIESGAFDFENPNRKELLNEYISIRNESKTKSQKEPLLENTTYDKVDCMEMEAKTLGRAITYDPAWKGALPDEPLSGNCTFKDIKHHITKSSHKKMAMLTVINETYAVPALLFPKEYPKYMSILKNYQGEKKDHPAEVFFVRGIMNKEGDKLIINKIEPMKIAGEEPDHAPSFVFDPMSF